MSPGASRGIGLALAVLAIACGRDGLAQERPQRPTGRFADHRFMESELVPLPFSTTNLVTALGGGSAPNVEVPVFQNSAVVSPNTIRGSLSYLTFRLEYQQALNDWLAASLGFGVAARVGTNSASLVSEGMSYQYSLEFGWLLRLHEWEHSRLAATVSLWNSTWGSVELTDWLRDVIASGGIQPGNEIYRETLSLSGGGGLRFAHALSPTLGLVAQAEGGVGESPNSTGKSAGYYRAALMMDADLNPRWRVPIGVALGFRTQTFPGVDPGLKWQSNQGIARLEYSARDEYAVGIETQFGSLPLTSGGSTFVTQTKISTRYYF